MENSSVQDTTWINTRKGRAMLIAIIATFVAVVSIAFGIHIYYMNRWYPNTWIGDRNVSGMTYEESSDLINKVFDNYTLSIKARNDGSLTISKEDINYKVNIQNSLKEQYDKILDIFKVI